MLPPPPVQYDQQPLLPLELSASWDWLPCWEVSDAFAAPESAELPACCDAAAAAPDAPKKSAAASTVVALTDFVSFRITAVLLGTSK